MKSIFKDKKGSGDILGNLGMLVIALVTIGVVLAVGLLIIANVEDQIVTTDGVTEGNSATYSAGYNATTATTNAIGTIPSWLGVIVIVVIGAGLIGLVSLFRGR